MALRPFIHCTASLLALGLANAAHAQAAAPQAPADNAAASQSAATDIVVTGVRASIVGALKIRKNSVQIVDSIVAEDVGKLPDNNVVEALQRVTGIQITDRASGEAATVTIRGLPDALTTLNGRNIFTSDGQSFALQDISANLVKQVDVYKTRSADQLETGLAGQIDVKTRHPFDFKGFEISGLARGTYDEVAKSWNPNLALLVSDRWDTSIGELGVLVNASYSQTDYRTESATAGALVPFATETPPAGSGLTPLQRIFSGWQAGTQTGLATTPGSTLNYNGVAVPYYLSRDAVFSSDLYGQRKRPSANIAIQWAPNSSSVYTAEAFYTGFRGHTYNSLMFSFVDYWANPQAVTLYPGTNIVKSRVANDVYGFNSGDYTATQTDSFVYGLNGKWDLGSRGKIVADVAYQDSTVKSQFFAMRTDRTADQISVDFNAGGGVPSYHFSDDSLLTQPSTWNVAQLYDNANRDHGSAITGTLDAYYTWDDGFLRQVKAGARFDDRKAQSYMRTANANGLGVSETTLPSAALFTNSNFFAGEGSVPRSWVNINGNWTFAHADYIRGLYGLPTSSHLSLNKTFDIDEQTTSAYALADGQLTIAGRPLEIEGGVRFVNVHTDYDFFDQYNSFARSTLGKNTYRFLPSATLRYPVTDNLHLRFNFGETLRRPNFTDVNPTYSLTGDLTNVGYGSGSSGNANLKPTTSKNYDVAVEWYFARNSALTVTGFLRNINGLVVSETSMVTIPNNGIVAGATDTFSVTHPVNASDGTLKGVEVGLTYFPSHLPGPLNGLGVQGSVTVLDSNQTIPITDATGKVTGTTQSPFFDVSKFSYNATLAYDHGPVSARLSYVWRNDFLHNNEAPLFANPIGVWYKAESSLDFQLTLNVRKGVGITFDAVNIMKTKQQNYYKFDNAGGSTTDNLGTTLIPRTFSIGARFAL